MVRGKIASFFGQINTSIQTNQDIRKTCYVLFSSLCLIGLIFQVNQVAQVYFSFKVLTSIRIEMPYTLEVPNLNICVEYLPLIDKVKYRDRFNITDSSSVKADRLTIRDIIDMTPPGDKIISRCLIRQPSQYTYDIYDNATCYSHFMVSKYYQQKYICYQFSQPGVRHRHRTKNLAYALSYPSTIYQLLLNDHIFSNTTELKIIRKYR